jgi:hypothetical protein
VFGVWCMVYVVREIEDLLDSLYSKATFGRSKWSQMGKSGQGSNAHFQSSSSGSGRAEHIHNGFEKQDIIH